MHLLLGVFSGGMKPSVKEAGRLIEAMIRLRADDEARETQFVRAVGPAHEQAVITYRDGESGDERRWNGDQLLQNNGFDSTRSKCLTSSMPFLSS